MRSSTRPGYMSAGRSDGRISRFEYNPSLSLKCFSASSKKSLSVAPVPPPASCLDSREQGGGQDRFGGDSSLPHTPTAKRQYIVFLFSSQSRLICTTLSYLTGDQGALHHECLTLRRTKDPPGSLGALDTSVVIYEVLASSHILIILRGRQSSSSLQKGKPTQWSVAPTQTQRPGPCRTHQL